MQVINLIAAGINFFLLPKIMSVSNYGIYQLYFVVVNLAGFLHLGAIDGLQLKIGGAQNKTVKNYLGNIAIPMVIINICVGLFYLAWIFTFKKTTIENLIILLAIFSAVFVNLLSGGILVLSALGKGAESLIAANFTRTLFIIGTIACILLNFQSVYIYLMIFIISGLLSLIKLNKFIGIPIKIISVKVALIKYWHCIFIGSKMLIVNGATLLFISLSALCIQYKYDITTFAKISFANGLLVMTISIGYTIGGLVYSEACKRKIKEMPELSQDKLMYSAIILSGLLMVAILPIEYIIQNWIINYIESLKYINLLFICILYDGIYSIFIVPMMKFRRMEISIFKVNLVILILALILLMMGIIFSMNTYYYSIVIVMCFILRSFLSIVISSKQLNVKITLPLILLVILTIGYFLSLSITGINRLIILITPVILILAFVIRKKLIITQSV